MLCLSDFVCSDIVFWVRELYFIGPGEEGSLIVNDLEFALITGILIYNFIQ